MCFHVIFPGECSLTGCTWKLLLSRVTSCWGFSMRGSSSCKLRIWVQWRTRLCFEAKVILQLGQSIAQNEIGRRVRVLQSPRLRNLAALASSAHAHCVSHVQMWWRNITYVVNTVYLQHAYWTNLSSTTVEILWSFVTWWRTPRPERCFHTILSTVPFVIQAVTCYFSS